MSSSIYHERGNKRPYQPKHSPSSPIRRQTCVIMKKTMHYGITVRHGERGSDMYDSFVDIVVDVVQRVLCDKMKRRCLQAPQMSNYTPF